MDGKTGIAYGKRFNVTGITRDKEYDLTKGNPNSKVLHFTVNPNGEAEVVTIHLSPGCKARVKQFDYPFEDIEIKNRSANGNQVTKYPLKNVKFKEKGRSTLSAQKIWYDDTTGRLNKEERGLLLGKFAEKDRIIVFYKEGNYELTDYELTNRYEADSVVLIEKFSPEKIVTAIYFDAKTKQFNVKRFKIESQTPKTKYTFIKDGEGNYMELVTTKQEPFVILKTGKKKTEIKEEKIALHEMVDITGWKTIGTFLAGQDFKDVSLVQEQEDINDEKNSPTLF